MFPTGSKLNYDLPVAPVTLPAGTVLPVAMTLDAALSLPAGLVLTGDVTAADGRVLRAGTVLAGELKLAPGAQLGAGFVLRGEAAVRAFTWPKGVPLPADLKASAQITLAQGSLIPSQTKLVLLGGKPVDLRPKGRTASRAATGLAPMLGAGASAWTLTAVAGADLGSADVRTRNVLSKGDLVMSDTHYGLAGRGTETSKTIFVGVMVLTPLGAEELIGDPSLAGKPIKPIADEWQLDWETMCSWGAYCEPEPRRVTAAGSQQWAGNASWVGKTVQEMAAALNKTEDAICANAAHCEGGGTSKPSSPAPTSTSSARPCSACCAPAPATCRYWPGATWAWPRCTACTPPARPPRWARPTRASTWRAAMTARPACWA